MMTIDQEALAARIADVALLHGEFTLRSGRTSSYYLDKYLFSTRPEVLSELAELFARRIPEGVDRLAGAELGGIPLVTATALRTGLPCLFIRNSKKDYGTSKQLEGVLEPGEKVILLEDVATTGGQALEAAGIMRDMGAEVVKVIATIDRLEGARENFEAAGITFESLFTKKDLGIDE
ncbi:MAG: orotate phosphoribosyltransferase [Phycisphaerales bacterium]|nr:orotate phosphoribosyltransferase [Phycisphaerales bacterium]